MAMRAISHASLPIMATHEIRLVLLSVVIAVIASYTALDLAGRVTLTQGRARNFWLTGGAIAMGIGIWSMHFIAMLAYHLPIPVNYDASIVLVSMVVAIITFSSETARRVEALRQTEERFLSLVQNSSDMITILEADGTIRYESSSVEHILGYRPEDLVGKNRFDYVHPEDATSVLAAFGNTIENPEIAIPIEYRFRHASGFWVYLESTHNNLLNNLTVKGIVLNSCDITERKRAEEALQKAHNELEIRVKERTAELTKANEQLRSEIVERKRAEEELRASEERFRLLVEGVKDYAIFMLDTHGSIISWNAGAERIKGYQAEEILGQHFSCFYPDEDIFLSESEQQLHLCEVNDQIEHEGWCVRKDGSRIWVNVVITALRDQDGKLRGFSNVTRDITERKWADEALCKSVATNRALLNAMPDLMFRISKDGIFVNFKAAKDDKLAVSFSEFLGKNLYEVLPTHVAQPAMDCVERALSTGDIQIFECQLLVNNNLLDYEARIVVSAENEVMAIVRDITERKRAEEDIRNALEKQKELGELKSRFISMTSHEFRTPLTTILSSAELLENYSKKWAEEKKLQHFHRIQTAVKQMTDLLNDVLLIGKAEAGKLECNPIALDLAQFCRELVEEFEISTRNKHTIAFCSQGECTTAACIDEKLLRHILSNLLSNAIKYSPKGGTVHFDLICHQKEAIFQVKDEGIGIPEADQAQLFDSFHRASNVGTISGTGLGLAIVKKSVDLHGGKIGVKSEVGVGTTFTVTLPLNQQQVKTDDENFGD